jgi:hypothetical protein
MLAGALAAGVFGLMPSLGWLYREWFSLSPPLPLLLPLGGVCVAYALLVLWTGRTALGLFVALLTFVTVWMPGLPGGPATGSFAFSVTQSPLSQLALLGLLVVYAWHGWWRPFASFTRAHLALGGFAAWTLASAPFVAGPAPGVAFEFGLYVLQAWLVFVVAARAVEDGAFGVRPAATVVAVVAIGHAAVGLVEFLTTTSIGPAGGRGGVAIVERLSLGPLGTYPAGPYVSGFVGSGALGSLLPVAAPLVLVLAVRARGVRRLTWLGAWLLCAAVLRATGWDTGRGALLVGTAVLAAGFAWRYRSAGTPSLGAIGGRSAGVAVAVGLGVLVTLVPSTDAGSVSRISAAVGGGIVGMAGFAAPVLAAAGGIVRALGAAVARVGAIGIARAARVGAVQDAGESPYDPKYLSPEGVLSTIDSLSVPLFDLTGSGIRVRQYVAGLDLFLQYPIFGIGGGNFFFVSEPYGLGRRMLLHDVYIALLAETGLPGFLLYVAAIGFVLAAGRRLLARTTTRERAADWWLALGLVAAVAAHLATMLFQPTYLRAQLLFTFWALCGVLVGAERRRRESQFGTADPAEPGRAAPGSVAPPATDRRGE